MTRGAPTHILGSVGSERAGFWAASWKWLFGPGLSGCCSRPMGQKCHASENTPEMWCWSTRMWMRNYRLRVAAFVRPPAWKPGSWSSVLNISASRKRPINYISECLFCFFFWGGGYCRTVGTNAWLEESRANRWCWVAAFTLPRLCLHSSVFPLQRSWNSCLFVFLSRPLCFHHLILTTWGQRRSIPVSYYQLVSDTARSYPLPPSIRPPLIIGWCLVFGLRLTLQRST